jgi:hypothetical protein
MNLLSHVCALQYLSIVNWTGIKTNRSAGSLMPIKLPLAIGPQVRKTANPVAGLG